jgi:hypothetical protein
MYPSMVILTDIFTMTYLRTTNPLQPLYISKSVCPSRIALQKPWKSLVLVCRCGDEPNSCY